jgi:K+-sensing histidine kinase KdpD
VKRFQEQKKKKEKEKEKKRGCETTHLCVIVVVCGSVNIQSCFVNFLFGMFIIIIIFLMGVCVVCMVWCMCVYVCVRDELTTTQPPTFTTCTISYNNLSHTHSPIVCTLLFLSLSRSRPLLKKKKGRKKERKKTNTILILFRVFLLWNLVTEVSPFTLPLTKGLSCCFLLRFFPSLF